MKQLKIYFSEKMVQVVNIKPQSSIEEYKKIALHIASNHYPTSSQNELRKSIKIEVD